MNGKIIMIICLLPAFASGCLRLDPEEAEAPELHIRQAGSRLGVLDIDPEEELLVSIHDDISGAPLAASAVVNSGDFLALKSGLNYIIRGVHPGGMGMITFSAMGKTGTLRVFVRNWKAAAVYRHVIYADSLQYPGDETAAYRIIKDAKFEYEAPDGVSSGTNREDARPLHLTPHIIQEPDSFLQKDVFRFMLHFASDGDMVGGYPDRQRLELKTMQTGPASGDPNDLMYSEGGGDRFTHRWKFRLPAAFAVSSEYTHLHQLKGEGGDSGNPTFTLTARRKSNGSEVMQLIYRGPVRANGDASQNTYPCEVPLKDFLGEWVRVEETVMYDSPGAFQFRAVRIRDMKTLMRYIYFPQKYDEVDPFVMFRNGNTYIRPKFGIYRRIKHLDSFGIPLDYIKDLKDETVLFADFEMDRLK